MRKLVYYIGISIDGFIAGPDDEVDFFPMSDDYLQWMGSEYGDALPDTCEPNSVSRTRLSPSSTPS